MSINKSWQSLQFLTWEEIYGFLDEAYLAQITNKNPQLLVWGEQQSIGVIKQFLASKYDLDFELRPINQFELSTEYADYARIKVKYSEAQKAFGTAWNIDLINQDFTKGEYVVLCKAPNTPAPQYLKGYSSNTHYSYTSRSGDLLSRFNEPTDNSYNIQNPDYNSNAGYLNYGTNGEKLFINRNYNPYNTNYESNYTTSVIDFSSCGLTDVENIIGNPSHFDQYTTDRFYQDFIKDDRNEILKMLMIDLLIYNVLQRVASHDISEHRKERYNAAMDTLKNIQKGQLPINLKLLPASKEKQRGYGFMWGHSYSAYRYDY